MFFGPIVLSVLRVLMQILSRDKAALKNTQNKFKKKLINYGFQISYLIGHF